MQRGNGTGGESIYGEKFRDENFTLKVRVVVAASVRPAVCRLVTVVW